jgi:DNA-binding GntR family transcriptional regulator
VRRDSGPSAGNLIALDPAVRGRPLRPVTLMFNKFSLSEQVEAALRQEITHGRLRPGERINASSYLFSWNVSITPRKGDCSLLAKTDQSVHDFGRNSCGDARLQLLLSSQMDLIQWTQNIAIRDFPESRQLAFPEPVAIMEAVCAHDATAAAHAMRAHLENAYRRTASQFEAPHARGHAHRAAQ